MSFDINPPLKNSSFLLFSLEMGDVLVARRESEEACI